MSDHTCKSHPDKAGKYFCAKYNRYLCEDCLLCQDPNIFCRHRTACIIWELTKYSEIYQKDTPADQKKISGATINLTFMPEGKTYTATEGETIMDVAERENIYINARCGGKGVCGSCKVQISSGKVECEPNILINDDDRNKGIVLACKAKLIEDVTVTIPEETQNRKLKIVEDASAVKELLLKNHSISPLTRHVSLKLQKPTLDNPMSDLDRVKQAIRHELPELGEVTTSLEALRQMSSALRKFDWDITITLSAHDCVLGSDCLWEIIKVEEYTNEPHNYGIAVDIGTTSVVVFLVDLSNGDVLGVTSAQNAQVVCGEDVISRIIYAKDDEHIEKLHTYVAKTINTLVTELIKVTKVKRNDIVSASLAGNTVMTQSILKLDPKAIRLEPYIPMATIFPILHAEEIGIKIHNKAGVYVVPGNAAYVGGDITAGIVASGLNQQDEITLFIDIGTNGEMVLGNKDWLMTAACSAGPAFEGGGIRHGVRALSGAIDDVNVDPETLELSFTTVDEKPAIGICGTGMISIIATFLAAKILDTSGKFSSLAQKCKQYIDNDDPHFIIAKANETAVGENIIISESDISTLIRSKAAIYGGIKTLLESSGMTMETIDQIQVAGGFGKYIDFDKAVILGMLPDAPREKFEYLGNSAIGGAYLALLSREVREELKQVSRAMTYIDFSSSNKFFDEYNQAMFLPHTEINDFPSVKNIFAKN